MTRQGSASRGSVKRVFLVLLIGVLAVGFSWWLTARSGAERSDTQRAATVRSDASARVPAPSASSQQRVVSLSPAITDTVVALGAQESLVLVSDYCTYAGVPRAGTALTPRFEAIAAARPTLIVATEVGGSRARELTTLGPFVELTWLTLSDVARSIRTLGELLKRAPEANELAARLERELGREAPPGAPRVLLVMGSASEARAGVWYIREDSLHGRLLPASGYRNAIAGPPRSGRPHLDVEGLLRTDPDAVLVLLDRDRVGPEDLAALLSLHPLRAVQGGRVAGLARPGILSMGPNVLTSRALVQAELDRLFSAHPMRAYPMRESQAARSSP